jgi:hypothetical protein
MAEFFPGLQSGEGGTALLTAACSGGSSSPQAASPGMTGLAGGPGGNG